MINATDATFAEDVEAQSGLTIVDFWATWCGPCRMLSPILDAIAAEGQVRVVKVNCDENQATAVRFGVHSIPMMLFFKDGQPVHQIVGIAPRKKIDATIAQLGGGHGVARELGETVGVLRGA
jgi:thioredoxin 1